MSVAGDVLLVKIGLYHILCLFIDYNVSCGNEVLLNLKKNELEHMYHIH